MLPPGPNFRLIAMVAVGEKFSQKRASDIEFERNRPDAVAFTTSRALIHMRLNSNITSREVINTRVYTESNGRALRQKLH